MNLHSKVLGTLGWGSLGRDLENIFTKMLFKTQNFKLENLWPYFMIILVFIAYAENWLINNSSWIHSNWKYLHCSGYAQWLWNQAEVWISGQGFSPRPLPVWALEWNNLPILPWKDYLLSPENPISSLLFPFVPTSSVHMLPPRLMIPCQWQLLL